MAKQLSARLAPKVAEMAPGMTSTFVRTALNRAIEGVGPLPPAADAATTQLTEQDGDVDRAVHEIVENHVRWAGAQGFVTNLGGLVTMTVTVPANIAGLALVQCRMIAAIAHLRGYDLDDPRVRNAILVAVLGEEAVNSLLKQKKIPGPPMAMATAPAHDPQLDPIVTAAVATELIGRVAGKRLASTVARRIPVAGGVVGMTADGFATWRIGRYAGREFLPRAAR